MLITALYVLTGGALAFWWTARAETLIAGIGAVAWAAAAMLPAAWLGARVARQLLPGKLSGLRWDGEGWAVRPADGASGDTHRSLRWLAVAVDLGPWLLLKAADASGARLWLVLRQRQAGPAWHLLRVAVQAHATGPGASMQPGSRPAAGDQGGPVGPRPGEPP